MSRTAICFLLVVSSLFAVSTAASAPDGPVIPINTTTDSYQERASVAMATDGHFVVVWQSRDQDNTGGTQYGQAYGVYARVFSATGVPTTGEILVNTTLPHAQTFPRVAINDSGSFVVTWQGTLPNGGSPQDDIFFRRFFANGSAIDGTEKAAHTTTVAGELLPDVALANDGSFVVSYSRGAAVNDLQLFFQRFDSTGTATGAETQVSTTSARNLGGRIGMDDANNFAIAFSVQPVASGPSDIYVRRYSAAGAALNTPETLVNVTTANQQFSADIAMNGSGAFVIAWMTNQDGVGMNRIYARQYTAAGAPSSGEFMVNTDTTSPSTFPAVGIDDTASFAVTWESSVNHVGGDIFWTAFDAAGTRTDAVQVVNSTLTGHFQTDVAMNGPGAFVVTWTEPDAQVNGVFAQRFCDGAVVYYRDADGDGFGNPAVSTVVCGGGGAPVGYVSDNTDCDDTNPAVHIGPTATVTGSQTINAGASATISAQINGATPIQVTWSDGVMQTVNATPTTITRNVSPAVTTTYTISVLSNASCNGFVTGSAVITVVAPPSITAAAALTRQQGTAPVNSQIATVSDDVDPAGSVTVTATSVPAGIIISAIVNANGVITADVSATCTATLGANAVTLTAQDLGGRTSTAVLTVNVTANTPPTLGTYPASTTKLPGFGTANIAMSAAPVDNGTFSLAVVAVRQGSGPALTPAPTVSPSGTINVGSPNPPGTYDLTVTATDNCGATSTAVARLIVNEGPPQITPYGPINVRQGQSVTDLLGMIADPDETPDRLTLVLNPPAGVTVTAVSIDAFGEVTATVTASCSAAVGATTIGMQLTDSGGATDNDTVAVNVTANAPPTLGSYSNTTFNAGAGGTVTPSAAPADDVAVTSLTANAAGYGALAINMATGVITVPAAIPGGTYTVTVTANDGCVSTPATFTLIINAPPVGTPVAQSRAQGTIVTGVTIATVSDPNDAPGLLTVSTSNATAGITVTNATNANGTVTADLSISCAAPLGAGSFDLTVMDTGGSSTTASIPVNVAANSAPVLGTYAVANVAPGGGTVANPSVAPSDNGTFVFSSNPGTFTGGISISPAGVVTLTAAAPPGMSTITITATDNCGATSNATLQVNVGSSPVANPDNYPAVEDTPLVVNAAAGVLLNDTDANADPLTAILDVQATHGVVVLNANGSFTYTPAANYHGPDSFTYHANDGTFNSATAVVTLTVASVNDAPVGPPGFTYGISGTTLSVPAPGLLQGASDVDGDPLTVVILTPPSHGTVVPGSGGAFVYTRSPGYFGPDSFTYAVNDGALNSAPITVSVGVDIPTLGGGQLALLALLLAAVGLVIVRRS